LAPGSGDWAVTTCASGQVNARSGGPSGWLRQFQASGMRDAVSVVQIHPHDVRHHHAIGKAPVLAHRTASSPK